MSQRVTVVGAGMAGLLAGCMLRDQLEVVTEQQEALPNNHSAVLRFRSDIVAQTLGIPFRKVSALKAVHPYRNAVAEAMAYSFKTNGTGTLRSVTSAAGVTSERFIAPSDLIQKMADQIQTHNIVFGNPFFLEGRNGDSPPVISTIPMPTLMDALGWEDWPVFKTRSGMNVSLTLKGVNAYFSLYVPNPEFEFARISVTGDQMIIESYQDTDTPAEQHAIAALHLCGINRSCASFDTIKVSIQKYAKILPIDERVRKKFIMWASDNYNVYSLGRFATWRPNLLLDDVVNDVRVIQSLIGGDPSHTYRSK